MIGCGYGRILTHHNHTADEDQVDEEVSRLCETRGSGLQIRSVREYEVWVENHAKLWSTDEEAGREAPYLWQLPECEDVVRREDKPIEIRYAEKIPWNRDEDDGCCDSSA